MRPTHFLLTLSLTLFSCFSAQAKSFFFMDADFGGDTLVDVTYTNGSKADIDAGRGIAFGGGIEMPLADSLDLQVSIAWKFTTIPQASNGDLTWTRLPVEVVLMADFDKFRLGGGLTYHMGNKLDGSGVAASLTEDFDNAFGTVLAFEHKLTPRMTWGLRYNMIEYTPSSGGPAADGSSFGFSLTFYGP